MRRGRAPYIRLTEATAKRQASAARAVVTRYENVLLDAGGRDPSGDLGRRLQAARQRSDAAEKRLDAIRSQEPDRTPGAWGTYPWCSLNVSPQEDEAWGERP